MMQLVSQQSSDQLCKTEKFLPLQLPVPPLREEAPDSGTRPTNPRSGSPTQLGRQQHSPERQTVNTNMCKKHEMVQNNANAAASSLTTFSFHGQTVLQSMIATGAMVIFLFLIYLLLRYMGYCRPSRPEEFVCRRWSEASLRRPRDFELRRVQAQPDVVPNRGAYLNIG